jgi:hypothetical protein
VVLPQADDKIPAGNIIDVIDAGNGNQPLDGQQVQVDKVTIGWTYSTGKNKIPLTGTQNFIGQPGEAVVAQIKALGFTNVQLKQDSPGSTQQPGAVTRISQPDGQYTADQVIFVYVAPTPPPSPTTTTSSQQCDPAQPGCQTPTSPQSQQSTSGNTPNPSCQLGTFLCPSSSATTSKKGGG